MLLTLVFSLTQIRLSAQCCTYTLSMHDSYGDGWNGGYLTVYLNNVSLGNFSASAFGSTDTFQVCNGDSLKLFYTAGAYENENSYQVYNTSWQLLHAAGPTPATGWVFDTLGDCSPLMMPGNHACNALPIDTGQCLWSDNSTFSGSGMNPGCANYQGKDVWFSMLVPPSGNICVSTDSGTVMDTGLAVWTDTTCTNLRLLGCDDDAGNGYFSFLPLYELTPGQRIYIQVFGYGGATGTFHICVKDLGVVTVDSTELPLVLIQTLGQQIVPDTKINCLMDIKYNGLGQLTYLTDSANVYHGQIGIEIRGATSAGYPQRPYNIETRTASGANNNVSLLGMPAENDWVLLSNFNDRSLVRNTLAYKLFGDMGHYSVRTSLCEVIIDSIYKGIYVFGEKIKRDPHRLAISQLNRNDTTGDQLSGGYILEQNHWNANNSFQSNYSPIDHPGFDIHFLYRYPGPDSIHATQRAYIAGYVDSLEDALYGSNYADPVNGYRKYLDVPSFIDYFIINELSRNNDGFKKSVYFHKDRFSKGGKLKAGPVWDFDWAWKTMATCALFDKNDGSGWAHRINDCPTDNYSCGYYIRLLQDSSFANELRCRWEDYRNNLLDTVNLFHYIDSIGNRVQFAQERHFKKWPILGMSGPAPEVNAIATTYAAELDTLKHWIATRIQWLDANLPGHCIVIPTGTSSQALLQDFRFYPNPSEGLVHFEGRLLSSSGCVMTICDMTGKEVDRIRLQQGQLNFDYRLERAGVYYFTIADEVHCLKSGTLFIH